MSVYKSLLTSLALFATVILPVQPQTSPESLAEGKSLYDVNCANCHGDAGEGAKKAGFEISIIAERGGIQPPDLTDSDWDHGSTDAEIFKVVKEGIPAGMMPSLNGRLSDSQIENVVAYLRSLASSPNDVNSPVSTATDTSEITLELEDYFEMPITGDMSTDRVSGVLARGSIMIDEPGDKQRFFLNDLTGPLYILDKQTKELTTYLNFAGLFPNFTAGFGYAAGMLNFVFDPEYEQNGIFYTLHMENVADTEGSATPKAGVVSGLNLEGYELTEPIAKPETVQDTRFARELVIVEWKDEEIGNTTFEGSAREVFRLFVPGLFHPFNEITFNPVAKAGDADWRVMYLGIGDAGTGERPGPMRMHAQRLDTYQGKVLRIIPMLNEHTTTSTISENGQYRIPNDNPFVSVEGARKEIWAYGLRNPHRLTWYIDPDQPSDPVLLAFNIGLVSWETVAIIKKGANYGYPLREGNLAMSEGNGMSPIPADDTIPILLSDTDTIGIVKPTYTVIKYPHAPGGGDAIANGFVYTGTRHKALQGTIVFGDITTGHIWYAKIKDVLAAEDGDPQTFAPIIEIKTNLRELSEETYRKRGGGSEGLPGRGAIAGAGRLDIRLAQDSEGELYVITKGDGMIRKFGSIK